MGRRITGEGTPLNLPLLTGVLAANTNPATAATVDTWECTLAGAPVGGDNPQVNIGLTNYGYVVQAAIQDIWDITIGGGFVPADTVRLTIAGGAGTPYDYVVLGGDDATAVAAGLAAAAAANGLYVASSVGPVVTLTQTIPGTGAAITSAFLAGAGTAIAVNTQVGAPITPNATMATAIAAAITADTGNNGYTAAAVGAVITITANVAGAPTQAVSSEYSPPSGGTGTFVAVNTIPGVDFSIPLTAGMAIGGSIAAQGSVLAFLNAGTSFVLQIWTLDPTSGLWLKDLTFGNKTINASGVYPWTVAGSRVYAYVSSFIGGADATVRLTTNS